MSKYTAYQARKPKKVTEIHPIWRGVGFAMIILIPILSIIGAIVIVDEVTTRGLYPLPTELLAKPNDLVVYTIFTLKLNTIIKQPQAIYVIAILAFALIVFLSAIFTMITFIVNRFFGVSRYGPYDVPDVNFKRKRKLY